MASRFGTTQLSKWAADPAKMARFEALALLCHRTQFVKDLLCLTDKDSLVKKQIQAVCDRHGVKFVFLRGNGFNMIHAKSLLPAQRYAASFLLNTLLSTDGGGIDLVDGIVSDNLLDRLLYSYHRYLSIFRLTPDRADISFEKFYFVFRSYLTGDVEMNVCENCASSYVNPRVSQFQCPLCTHHAHAILPSRGRLTSLIENEKVALSA